MRVIRRCPLYRLSRAQPYAGPSCAKLLGIHSCYLSILRRFQTVQRRAQSVWPRHVGESPAIGQSTMPITMVSRVRISDDFQTETLPNNGWCISLKICAPEATTPHELALAGRTRISEERGTGLHDAEHSSSSLIFLRPIFLPTGEISGCRCGPRTT
jgi:hypothetical protein